MKKDITTVDLIEALRQRYRAPEWALMLNVGTSTGFSNGQRYADAVAMTLWPSRGFEVHGFEVKTSRKDFLNEGKRPEKAEAIARYCDYWWIVTPSGLLDNMPFPGNWGLLTWNRNVWKIEQKAAALSAQALDRPFVASLLRRANEKQDEIINHRVDSRIGGIDDIVNKRVAEETYLHKAAYDQLLERITSFEQRSGINIDTYNSGRIADAVKLLRSLGITKSRSLVTNIIESLRDATETLENSLAATNQMIEGEPQANGKLPTDEGDNTNTKECLTLMKK